MKQRRPATTDDGMKDDAVLVDEPPLLERSRELGRSDEDTPLGLRFQRRDRLAKVTLYVDRVLPRKLAPRAELDTTYFAFASSFCAHSRIARGAFSSRATAGQAASISS